MRTESTQLLTIAVATAGSILAATATFAADLPVKAPIYTPAPAFSWTGCYIGAGGGYVKPDSSSVPISGDPNLLLSQTLGNVPLAIKPTGDGYTVGPQIGCNYQLDRIVIGAEADLYYMDATRELSVTQGPNVVTTRFSQELSYLGTLRLRLGYTIDRAMIYATGGLAYGKVEASAVASDAALTSVVAGSDSNTKAGYTLGGGIEYALTTNWSFKGEYLYYNLGRETLTINAILGPAETVFFDYETSGHIFRTGLNYRF